MCWSQTNVIKKQPYKQYRHTLGPYLHCSAIKKERATLAALTQNRPSGLKICLYCLILGISLLILIQSKKNLIEINIVHCSSVYLAATVQLVASISQILCC